MVKIAAAALALGLALPGAAGAATRQHVVTIKDSGGDTYQIRLIKQSDIDNAKALLAGDENAPKIPNGKVIRGTTDINTGHKWHIDPTDFSWADFTMELCDGRVADVDANRISGNRFCPWNGKVVALRAL